MSDSIYLVENANPIGPPSNEAVIIAAKTSPLSKYRCAVFFDSDGTESKKGERLNVTVNGTAQNTPLMILRLPLNPSGQRTVILLTVNGSPLHRQDVQISYGKTAVAQIDPLALQSPMVDQLSLLAGLSKIGQTRFLRTLLTTGPSLFKSDATPSGSLDGFERIIAQLLSSLSSASLQLRSFRALGSQARMLSYVLPANSEAKHISDLVQVVDGKARRISSFTTTTEVTAKGTMLHLTLAQPLAPNANLIGMSDIPISLSGPKQDQDLRPLQPWLHQQTPSLKNHIFSVLKELSASDPVANNLYQELRCPQEQQPQLDVLYSSYCGDGLLYALKTSDPRNLLSTARWVCGTTGIDAPLAHPVWHKTFGDIYVGYLSGFDLSEAMPNRFELWGVTKSQRAFRVDTIEPQKFDGRVPQIFDMGQNHHIDQMLGHAVSAAIRERHAPNFTKDWFGERPTQSDTTLLIFVDDNFEYPRALVTLLAQEAGREKTIAFLIATDPAKRTGLRHLAEVLNAATSCSVAVLCFDAQTLPSECLRVALAQETSATNIVFQRACLPEKTGWLSKWKSMASTVAQIQTASIELDRNSRCASSSRCCRVLNHAAAQALLELPLISSSLDVDLARLDRMSAPVTSKKHTVICYDNSVRDAEIQLRADAQAVSLLEANTL